MNRVDVNALGHVSYCGQGQQLSPHRLFEAPLDLQIDINVCSHDVFAEECITQCSFEPSCFDLNIYVFNMEIRIEMLNQQKWNKGF